MRINKYLASCGICSRRNAEELIISGKIMINGKVVTDLSTIVSDNDVVMYNGKKVSLELNKVYLMLNKPKCYICSLKDEKDRLTVLKLTKGIKERIFPIGRLDYNTEGLLLLTNDGDFANQVIHPRHHIAKTYNLTINGILNKEQLRMIETGIVLDDGIKTLPAKYKITEKITEVKSIVGI